MKGRAPRKGDFYTDKTLAFIFLHFFFFFGLVNKGLKQVKV